MLTKILHDPYDAQVFSSLSVSGRTKRTVHQHSPRMYPKLRSVLQPRGVPVGDSDETGCWVKGAAAVGVPAMGLAAAGLDACLPFAMTVIVASA
jgi:hypothetical protein